MIIRPAATSQFLITQPEHAALAAHIMRHWTRDGLAESPRRDDILLAVGEHDNGWQEVDRSPIVDEKTCRLLDFIHAPVEIRRGVWPIGVERLSHTPYAAALVAQHAVHIFSRFRSAPEWASFFETMEAARNRHLQAASVSLAGLERDYAFVRLGDLLSLMFCNGWTEAPTGEFGYTVRPEGSRLLLTPDPFDGQKVSLEILARELTNQSFASRADAVRAFVAAPRIVLRGVILGG